MSPAEQMLLLGFETHDPDTMRRAISEGLDLSARIDGRLPFTWLLEMYARSARFSECVRTLHDAGAEPPDVLTLAVLLDDAEMVAHELDRHPAGLDTRVDIRCAFTPLQDATLLHLAAEFGLCNAARALLDAGLTTEVRAGLTEAGFGGHTPIFHTVNTPFNHSGPILQLLLDRGARTDVRLAGLIWGEGFEWETPIYDPTPFSYAQCGLLPQFQRGEADVYANIRLMAASSLRNLPGLRNVPNAYLQRGQ